jgi:molybdate transport system substrate-binding protein
MRPFRPLVLLFAAVVLGGATPSRAADPLPLTVFAAADLAFALRDLAPRFEKAVGVKVSLVLGSTGNLARQIEHGAPADLFFAANESFVDDLARVGAVIPETKGLYGQGRLVLATSRALGPKLTDLRQLAEARVRRVAIANPQHAPYGKAAEQALRKVGVWEAVQPKLVYGENIRHTLQFLQTGAAEAGIVALSVANVPEIHWVAIDSALHAPLNQVVAVVRKSGRPELGLAFIQFIGGPEGRRVMKSYGFLLPGEF